MIDKKKVQDGIKDVLVKLEEATFLLKDGKQILAYNKINGVKQKMGAIYNFFEEKNEENKDA